MTSIYTDEYRGVIDLLAQTRKAAGVTQQQLAKALGQPQSFVSKVERGDRRLDIVEFVHFCRAIGTDPYEMLSRSGLVAGPTKASRGKPR